MGNPEYGGNERAAISFTAAVEVGAAAEEGEDFVLLVGCQFQVCHAAMITTKCQHGLGSPTSTKKSSGLMGDIAIKQIKMNSADEFRAALAGNIPLRYLDPNAPWDGRPLA